MKIKFSHERHETHENALAFKRGNRKSPFVNFTIFRTGHGWLNSIFLGIDMLEEQHP